ncbi:MAG: hypothetical protein D6696_05475 [Acidobacteria bacterium]|nr:MAG: hypothetical protein D6696_05475 [Acidobacteriota bacterium]
MRTTLTLESDVAARLKREMKRRGVSFKETVNAVLRRGLLEVEREEPPSRFVVRPQALEARPGVDFDDVPELLERLDGPLFR